MHGPEPGDSEPFRPLLHAHPSPSVSHTDPGYPPFKEHTPLHTLGPPHLPSGCSLLRSLQQILLGPASCPLHLLPGSHRDCYPVELLQHPLLRAASHCPRWESPVLSLRKFLPRSPPPMDCWFRQSWENPRLSSELLLYSYISDPTAQPMCGFFPHQAIFCDTTRCPTI